MTSDNSQRVNELFEAALRRSPEERASFLKQACAQDADLHSRVVSLLSHYEHADRNGFLENPPNNPARDQHQRRARFPIRLNCPHCRNPIAIAGDGTEQEVVCPACGSTFRIDQDRTVSWAPDKLPKLEKFELLESVGRGAFGTVYRAHDTELDRIVAVKVPRSGSFATTEDEDRFVREARSVAQLKHPGIVPVYEVGRNETFPFIVTEFIHGRTLSDQLSVGRFNFQQAAALVEDVARALVHAHEKGVVHRDLKPSNIMLERTGAAISSIEEADATDETTSGYETHRYHAPSATQTQRFRPRLMDFGLALREEGEITVTMDGQILGTPAYMSPEQARGESHRVDGRSDLYSLGVILYQMLAGELPFRGNARMLIDQVINDEPQSPRKLNDSIPKDLETICLKCLQKDPGLRYASARELADDLRQYLLGEPIRSRRISPLDKFLRWCKKPARISEAGILSIIVGAVGSLTTVVGLILVLLGIHAKDSPGRAILNLCGFVVLYWAPIICSGIGILRGSAKALWSGLAVVTLVGLFILGLFFANYEFGGLYTRPELKMSLGGMCSLLAFAVAVYDGIALVAYYKGQPVRQRESDLQRGSRETK